MHLSKAKMRGKFRQGCRMHTGASELHPQHNGEHETAFVRINYKMYRYCSSICFALKRIVPHLRGSFLSLSENIEAVDTYGYYLVNLTKYNRTIINDVLDEKD